MLKVCLHKDFKGSVRAMMIECQSIKFQNSDMAFVKKYGLLKAAEVILDFKKNNPVPFIGDAFQLASFFEISYKQLFRAVRNCNKTYRYVTIKKKNGNDRMLLVPCKQLKQLQKIILRRILNKIPVSEYATAYKKGAMLYDNASPHTNKKYILKIDITDFFNSIYFTTVYRDVFRDYYSEQISYMLTKLCCKDDFLPQGAPTSPALSNLVLKDFDDYIGRWCKRRGVTYTRYCDDMTFSSDEPIYYIHKKVKDELDRLGFDLNEKKTVFVSNAKRQSVTGLTVNEKVTVSKDYKRKLRQEVHYALKFGFEDAIMKSNNRNFIVAGNDEELPDALKYKNTLVGRVNFVLQIEPENKWFKTAAKDLAEKDLFECEIY